MTSKSRTLTEEQLEDIKKSYIHPYLNAYKKEKSDYTEVKILDWGCGRGKLVSSLLLEGFDAYGVDIDPLVCQQSQELFERKGWNHVDRIQIISKNNLTPFDDKFFDIILSEQVFEHVSDIESLALEISRITKPGGIHIHRWPAKFKVVEPHLFMPFVHWLPKGMVRKALIYFYVKLGVEPYWKELEHNTDKEKVDVYNSYSTNKTYYRSLSTIRKKFSGYCDIEFKSNPKINNRLMASIIYRTGLNHFVAVNFQSVFMVAYRNDK